MLQILQLVIFNLSTILVYAFIINLYKNFLSFTYKYTLFDDFELRFGYIVFSKTVDGTSIVIVN